MSKLVNAVIDAIDEAKGFALSRKHLIDTANQSSIAELIQTKAGLKPGQWCSISASHRIDDALLWGLPPVVAITPERDAKELERKWGYGVSDLVELASAGLILPSIYHWKDPSVWNLADERILPLIEQSTAIAPAVGEYLSVLPTPLNAGPREDQLRDILFKLSDSELLAISQDERNAIHPSSAKDQGVQALAKDLSMAWGSRWAYLDSLASDGVSERVEELFADGRTQEAADYLRWQKHLVASPVTAAVGGLCLWGEAECNRAHRARIVDPEQRNILRVADWHGIDPKLLRLASALLVDEYPAASRQQMDIKKVIELVQSREFKEERTELIRMLQGISSDWWVLVSNKDSALERARDFAKKRTKFLGNAIWASETALTTCIGLLLSGPIGMCFGLGAGFVLRFSSDKLAEGVLSVDSRHRLLLKAQKIRNRKQD